MALAGVVSGFLPGWGTLTAQDLDAWKTDLATIAQGAWTTSNADYVEEDGGMDRYGMAFRPLPGGVAAEGCLWGEREGEVVSVFWRFFQAWDPVREAGFLYQTHAAGPIAFGYFQEASGDEPTLVQDLWGPDGSVARVGHVERMEGRDTRISRSVHWTGEQWAPRRAYTWHRERGADSPCWEGAR